MAVVVDVIPGVDGGKAESFYVHGFEIKLSRREQEYRRALQVIEQHHEGRSNGGFLLAAREIRHSANKPGPGFVCTSRSNTPTRLFIMTIFHKIAGFESDQMVSMRKLNVHTTQPGRKCYRDWPPIWT